MEQNIVIAGIISFYNMNIIYKGVNKVEAVTGEMHKSYGLQLALDMGLMPVIACWVSKTLSFIVTTR